MRLERPASPERELPWLRDGCHAAQQRGRAADRRRLAIEFYQEAVEINPEFAEGFSYLPRRPDEGGLDQAESSARKGLALALEAPLAKRSR